MEINCANSCKFYSNVISEYLKKKNSFSFIVLSVEGICCGIRNSEFASCTVI